MVLRLNDAATVAGLVASLLAIAGGGFVILRYIIRAETSELRPNGGGSIKDVVHRMDERLGETERKLDAHVEDSKKRIERGGQVETELREALTKMAEALPIVAASTPPEQN